VGHLRIYREIFDKMLNHAKTSLPHEAVGLLAGTAESLLVECFPLPNLSKKPEISFLADPYAQFKAIKQLSAAGLHATALYHSHPDGGAGLSDHDLYFARESPYFQIVIALDGQGRTPPEIVAFSLVHGKPVTIPFRVLSRSLSVPQRLIMQTRRPVDRHEKLERP
jgi:proteasome lid subunit RPN8/RPN11